MSMKKVVKKKITIDDLAIMVAKGFDEVSEKLNKEIGGVKSELNEVKNRLDKIEVDVRATRRDMLNMGDKFVSYSKFDDLSLRVSTLEKKSGKNK